MTTTATVHLVAGRAPEEYECADLGADAVTITDTGTLTLHGPDGKSRHYPPHAWRKVDITTIPDPA